MMFLYNVGIRLFGLAVRILANFKTKPRQWLQGRRNWKTELSSKITEGNWIWMHCASLGEFEQGRPLLERIRKSKPHLKILLTFFSPSGYEIRKDYAGADHVAYLPLDIPGNARYFLDTVQPEQVFFVKYDIWINYILEIGKRDIPLFLVSALLTEKSNFFSYALKGLYIPAFRSFSWIFTQDEKSRELLKRFAGIDTISVAGDTRFDRALELPDKFSEVEGIAEFIGGKRCIVAGSPWPPDEAILLPAIAELREYDLKWIIAPHEIHVDQIDAKIAENAGRMAKYSKKETIGEETEVLWIDNVGMLSRLYHYSSLVYIGGGFGSGIHNTQEPAVYGNPVIFGPKYDKFMEAVDMVREGGAVSVTTTAELVKTIKLWLDDEDLYARIRLQNIAYMKSQAGATAKVMAKVAHFQPTGQ